MRSELLQDLPCKDEFCRVHFLNPWFSWVLNSSKACWAKPLSSMLPTHPAQWPGEWQGTTPLQLLSLSFSKWFQAIPLMQYSALCIHTLCTLSNHSRNKQPVHCWVQCARVSKGMALKASVKHRTHTCHRHQVENYH